MSGLVQGSIVVVTAVAATAFAATTPAGASTVGAAETTATTFAAAFATTTIATAALTAAAITAAAFTTAAIASAAFAWATVTTATFATAAIATTPLTTTTTITATATKTTGAGRTCLHRTGFIHHRIAPTQRLTIHAIDGGLRFSIAAHFDKAKAFGSTGVTFHHDFGAGDNTEFTEGLFQIVVTNRIRQVADVKFIAHERDSSKHRDKSDGAPTTHTTYLKTSDEKRN
jgi:hypothetical protein